MKKKNHIFIYLYMLCSIQMFGQYRPMENYPSPNVASLGEYGNIPVSMFTGIPNISIPLYEVKEGTLSLPITLDYNLANVKPNRRSGWVGLGWNLSAGGYITRNVRGVYDEIQNTAGKNMGFYSNYDKLQSINNQNTLGNHKDNFCGEKNGITVYELMSDEYSFHFGKYSGNFYLDEYGKWVIVSDDDIKVEFDPSTGFRTLQNLRSEIKTNNWSNKSSCNRFFDQFTLVTPDGVKYHFGGKYATEYSISYYNRNGSYLVPTTWFLTKIESPEGYIISLEYEAGLPICEIQFAAFSSYTYMGSQNNGSIFSWEYPFFHPDNWLNSNDASYKIDNTAGKRKLSGYLIFPVYLKTIIASYVHIDLHSGNAMMTEREPFPEAGFMAWDDYTNFKDPFSNNAYTPRNQFAAFMPGPDLCKIQTEYLGWRTLRAISIVPSDTNYTKTYYLEYNRTNRNKLTRIAEIKGDYQIVEGRVFGGWWDCNGNENLGYLFYYSTPPAGDVPKDYRFTYNMEEKFPRYIFASVDHWGYYEGGERSFSETILFDNDFYQSRNPTDNLTTAKAETLKEIIYPTGGKTCFEYTQNRYSRIVPVNLSETLEQTSGNAGGICVSEVNSYDANNTLLQTKRYYYTDTIPTNSIYTTSGILKAKKHYSMSYSFPNGYLVLCSEGGFLTTGTNRIDSHISYSTVVEETLDGSGNSNGFVRYRYTNFDSDIWGEIHRDDNYLYSYNISGNSYYTPSSSKSMERGKIISEEYFNPNGRLLKSVKYQYIKTNESPLKTIYQEKIMVPYAAGLNDYNYAYIAFMAPTYTYRYLVNNIIETDYDLISGHILQIKEKTQNYNSHKLLELETIKNSQNVNFKTAYKYPFDFGTTEPYNAMVNRHILTPVVEKIDYKENEWLRKEKTEYMQNDNQFVPQSLKTQHKNQANPETRITYMEYTGYGKPLKINKDGIIHYYIWSFNGQYLNAQLTNMPENAQLIIPNEDQFYEDEWSYLREEFPNAHISSFIHIPTIGLTQSTTPDGTTIYYDYDNFGRLKESYYYENNDYSKKRVIEIYNYHYKNK